MAAVSAFTDLSRPTNRGCARCGKITTSRRGRTGAEFSFVWDTLDLVISYGVIMQYIG